MLGTKYEMQMLWITVLTAMLQLYIFYLIRFVSPKCMRGYCYFLYLLAVFDILFNLTLGLLLMPMPVSPFYNLLARGVCSLVSQEACAWSAGLTIYTGGSVIAIQFYSLMYRFFILLSRKRFIEIFMSLPVMILFWLFIQVLPIVLGFMFYKTLHSSSSIAYYLREDWSGHEVALLPGEKILSIDAAVYIARPFVTLIFVLICLVEILSVAMIIGIIKHLRKNASVFSKATYRLHLQLTALLGFQLFSPLILIFVPILVFIRGLTNVHANTLDQKTFELGFTLLMLYGTVNSFSTLVFVGPYRCYTYKTFIKPTLKRLYSLLPQKISSSSAFGPSTQSVEISDQIGSTKI